MSVIIVHLRECFWWARCTTPSACMDWHKWHAREHAIFYRGLILLPRTAGEAFWGVAVEQSGK